ncbi:hypothetical protein DRQ50_07670 [bacterium]|nr:MAG: hypothetical protein DRQ50_07670 [bacterium]
MIGGRVFKRENGMNRARTVTILTMLGGAIFFVSWAAQNYLQPGWAARLSKLETSQNLLQLERMNREMWQIQFNLESTLAERKTDNDHRERFVEVAYNYLDAIQNIYFWESWRVAGEGGRESLPVSKTKVTQRANTLYLARDLEGLVKLVHHYDDLLTRQQSELDVKFGRELGKVRAQSRFWDRVFLWGYIVASLLIATRWYLTAWLGWPGSSWNKELGGTPS